MSSKTGRNDPCPCGSGQKYKRCCLARAEAARLARMEPLLFEALEEPTGDDEWLDGLDDPPPLDVSAVTRVRYERGFVNTIEELQAGVGLRATEWIAPAIPREILDSIQREALDELDGSWGDPAAGDPIQVDVIELHTGDDVIIVEMINRAIFLIHTDSDTLKSIHRVCHVLEAASAGVADVPLRPDPEYVAGPEDDGPETEERPRFDCTAVTKVHRRQRGRCELCGAGVAAASASRHVARCAPAHDVAKGPVKTLVQIRVTAPGLSGYWLDIETRDDARLEALDAFLRHIWLECCGHLSQFSAAGIDYFSRGFEFGSPSPFGARRTERSMSTRLSDALLDSGGRILYEYDFGSTTQLKLDVKGARHGRIGRQPVRLCARNSPLVWPCGDCGEPAAFVCPCCGDTGANPFVCATHANSHSCEEGEVLMPIVNSPRSGVCGYATET